MMHNKYGAAPYRIAVVHGGPGALGGMAAVAKTLSNRSGVIEPIQTADSVQKQIGELEAVLEKNAAFPVILIGHSWGAVLSLLFAAARPDLVKKIILVGTPPLEKGYAEAIQKTRLKRMSGEERAAFAALEAQLKDPDCADRDEVFARMGALMTRVDACRPADTEPEEVQCRYDIYQNVWREAARLRESGKLLRMIEPISCPVVAIHGENDPHPVSGVQNPLSHIRSDFRLVVIDHCGHTPWLEKEAGKRFDDVLEKEVSAGG